MAKVEIRVIRKLFYPELAEHYLAEGKAAGPCPLLEEGDEFIYDGGAEKPKGLCPWAWIDIYRGVSALAAGAATPWYRNNGQEIFCCTDGVRPVVFALTALPEETENGSPRMAEERLSEKMVRIIKTTG